MIEPMRGHNVLVFTAKGVFEGVVSEISKHGDTFDSICNYTGPMPSPHWHKTTRYTVRFRPGKYHLDGMYWRIDFPPEETKPIAYYEAHHVKTHSTVLRIP